MDFNFEYVKSISGSPLGVTGSTDSASSLDQSARADYSGYHKRFSGMGRLIGKSTYLTLAHTHVMIIGLGGVGSWAAESLARSGVGKITLVDLDDICITNTNRQLPALVGTVGVGKVQAMADRLVQINPEIEVVKIEDFYVRETADQIFALNPDYIIDGIDNLGNKAHLIAECAKRGVKLIVSGGAGGKIDPTLVRSSDLGFSTKDKMLRSLRRKLKVDFDLDFYRKKSGVMAVYSEEAAVYPGTDGETCQKPEKSIYGLDCKGGMGSASFVTGTFGFVAASIVIKDLKNNIF